MDPMLPFFVEPSQAGLPAPKVSYFDDQKTVHKITYADSMGTYHRSDGPSSIEYYPSGIKKAELWCVCLTDGTEPAVTKWHPNGNVSEMIWAMGTRRHRNNGPAVLCWDADGVLQTEEWWRKGKQIFPLKV